MCLIFADELIVHLACLIIKFERSLDLAFLVSLQVSDFDPGMTLLFEELTQLLISFC